MRSAAQLACILTLVGYSISFLTHNNDAVDSAPKPNSSDNTPSTHFCAISSMDPADEDTNAINRA